ncbi:uncharacterized protein LOC111054517 [Nilaparvata lugens]|uniref:uncharacterized protein LOC111054517 n=1 Tax=Nilaparvata lugens TaxID=108931 RepID=UPI00193D2188|nr:uncharacterized protein LOC111054517 [Nilaparvata lugens]
MPRWRAADRFALLQLQAVALLAVAAVVAVAAVAAPQPQSHPIADEQSARSERSANLSHITGPARKIRMYVRHGCLQLQPDGAVSSSPDHMSPYTILQRWSVGPGQLKIQGVASCMHLCLDPCGLLYGSRDMNDECVFNEMMEQHHYNTYSSAKYSNTNRTVYLALDRAGLPRKVQVKAGTPLGKLSKWTRVLTQTVATPPATTTCPTPPPPSESRRCRRKKKKKKRRKCPPAPGKPPCDDEVSNEDNHNGRLLRRKCDGKPCRLLVTSKKVTASRPQRKKQQPTRHQHQTRHLHHLRHIHRPQADEPPHDDPFDLEEEDDDATAAPDALDDETTATDLPLMLLVDAND